MEYDYDSHQGQDPPETSIISNQQQRQHPFGQEEHVSAEQLFKSFCNNLYLGQWELARACGLRLSEIEDFERRRPQDITEVLKAVVRHPYHR